MSVACGRSTVTLGTATERAVIVLPRAVSCPGASWPIHLLEHHPRSKAGHMAELPITGTSQSQVTSSRCVHVLLVLAGLLRSLRPLPLRPGTSAKTFERSALNLAWKYSVVLSGMLGVTFGVNRSTISVIVVAPPLELKSVRSSTKQYEAIRSSKTKQ